MGIQIDNLWSSKKYIKRDGDALFIARVRKSFCISGKKLWRLSKSHLQCRNNGQGNNYCAFIYLFFIYFKLVKLQITVYTYTIKIAQKLANWSWLSYFTKAHTAKKVQKYITFKSMKSKKYFVRYSQITKLR